MRNALVEIRRLTDAGETVCRVTVVAVRGSAPREVGAEMLVTASGLLGSIGGGQLEYDATRTAVAKLLPGAAGEVRNYPLGAACGQCCGGVVDLMFEVISPSSAGWLDEALSLYERRSDFVVASGIDGKRAILHAGGTQSFGLPISQDLSTQAAAMLEGGDTLAFDRRRNLLLRCERETDFQVAVFGAGHTGSAVVATLASLQANVRWIDSRRKLFPRILPEGVQAIESATPAAEVAALPPAAYYLVMTHSHALDFDITDQVLRRQDARYCGLIGSPSKRRRFERLMKKQGMSPALLQSLTCPIGIAGVDGKTPMEIAIAVSAELLQIRSRVLRQDLQPRNLQVVREAKT